MNGAASYTDPMAPFYALGIIGWLVGGLIVGAYVKERLEKRLSFTERAEWFCAVTCGLFLPAYIAVTIPWWLVGVLRDVYRGFFPAKPKTDLPEARVLR